MALAHYIELSLFAELVIKLRDVGMGRTVGNKYIIV